MRFKQLVLTAGVVAAIVLLDVAISLAAVSYNEITVATLVLTQIVTQLGLAAAWICIGPQALIPRVLAGIVVALAAFLQLESWGVQVAEEFELATVVEVVVILSALAALQLGGYGLVRTAPRSVDEETASENPQFSILQLMVATAVVAAVLAGLVRASNLPIAKREFSSLGLVIGSYFAAVTLGSLVATTLFERSAVPVATVVLASMALGLGIAVAMGHDSLMGPAPLLMGVMALAEVRAFGLLRSRGFRLRRVRRWAREVA